jgi:basic membrane protein A and related proteins
MLSGLSYSRRGSRQVGQEAEMRRKFVLGGLVLALAVTALALAGGSAARSEQDPFKVAFIYPGPHNDGGWSQSHDRGRLAIEKALGNKVETTYKENIFSNAQVPQVVAGLVRQGYDMIFGCSFGMFENGVNGQLYSRYPDVLFEQATGLQVKKNQSEYFGAGEDTIYLSGMAAGAASKKGLIGYIVPFGIPEVVRHINAFALGAQATNPKARVKLLWTNSWVSPPKETAAAKNLIAAGVDVLGQNVDTPAAGVVAEAKGIPWVGYDSDARKTAPKQWLTAAVYNWGQYYVKRVRAAINGTWKAGFYYGTIKDGFTSLAPFGPKVSAKTRAAILAKQKAIVAGKFNVFTGPILDQKGKVVVPRGKTLKVLPDLYSMQWLAKGVIGKVSTVQPPG